MASTSELGHNRNAINFDTLIISCTSFGTSYNPAKTSLKIPALQAQATATRNSLIAINTITSTYKNSVAARVTAFKAFDKLITRINNALKASDTSKQIEESVQTIIRKLQGKRATPKKTEEEKKTALEAGIEIVEISSSQMSYDSRLDNFDKLIKLLLQVPQYAPNEAELKITSLTSLYNELKAKNLSVITAEVSLSNARIARNDIMYKENSGLVFIAVDVKTYIKSVFGATSPQFKQTSKLKMRNYMV